MGLVCVKLNFQIPSYDRPYGWTISVPTKDGGWYRPVWGWRLPTFLYPVELLRLREHILFRQSTKPTTETRMTTVAAPKKDIPPIPPAEGGAVFSEVSLAPELEASKATGGEDDDTDVVTVLWPVLSTVEDVRIAESMEVIASDVRGGIEVVSLSEGGTIEVGPEGFSPIVEDGPVDVDMLLGM